MHIYAVYDERTGKVLQTHAKYVLGNDAPVACTEEEILEIARPHLPSEARLRVAKLPEGVDLRARGQKLEVDPGTGSVRAVAAGSEPRMAPRRKGV
jgi:hypothetical protein